MGKDKVRRVSFDPDATNEQFTEVLKYTNPRSPYSSAKNHFEVLPGEVFCTDPNTANYLLSTFPDHFAAAEVKASPGRPKKDITKENGQKAGKKDEDKSQKQGEAENKGA